MVELLLLLAQDPRGAEAVPCRGGYAIRIDAAGLGVREGTVLEVALHCLGESCTFADPRLARRETVELSVRRIQIDRRSSRIELWVAEAGEYLVTLACRPGFQVVPRIAEELERLGGEPVKIAVLAGTAAERLARVERRAPQVLARIKDAGRIAEMREIEAIRRIERLVEELRSICRQGLFNGSLGYMETWLESVRTSLAIERKPGGSNFRAPAAVEPGRRAVNDDSEEDKPGGAPVPGGSGRPAERAIKLDTDHLLRVMGRECGIILLQELQRILGQESARDVAARVEELRLAWAREIPCFEKLTDGLADLIERAKGAGSEQERADVRTQAKGREDTLRKVK